MGLWSGWGWALGIVVDLSVFCNRKTRSQLLSSICNISCLKRVSQASRQRQDRCRSFNMARLYYSTSHAIQKQNLFRYIRCTDNPRHYAAGSPRAYKFSGVAVLSSAGYKYIASSTASDGGMLITHLFQWYRLLHWYINLVKEIRYLRNHVMQTVLLSVFLFRPKVTLLCR